MHMPHVKSARALYKLRDRLYLMMTVPYGEENSIGAEKMKQQVHSANSKAKNTLVPRAAPEVKPLGKALTAQVLLHFGVPITSVL